MRIARIITRLNVGGPARHVCILSDRLQRVGYETWLLTGTEGSREGYIIPEGLQHVEKIDYLRREVRPQKDLRAYRELQRRLKLVQPRIVHTHMAKAGVLGRLAASRMGVPLILHTFHGHVLEKYFSRPSTLAFLRVEQFLARRTDVLIAVSNATRDSLLALGIGRPDQWKVIPLGLEMEPLLRTTLERKSARDRLGIASQGPLISIVGRLVPIKDHDTFLRMAERVTMQRKDASFLIAGDGELREKLEARVNLSTARVHMPGWVHDLGALYAASDVVVLTSQNEGTPVALIEAAAAARPCVATRVGGVEDVVVDGVTGIVTEAADDFALAAAVLRLLKDSSTARSMGDAARQYVKGRFSAERLVKDLATLYEELLEEKGLPLPAGSVTDLNLP